jgi:hypothetical protein
VAWTTTKPGNYVYFNKTVTGALSLPVESQTLFSNTNWTVTGVKTGNVVQLRVARSSSGTMPTGGSSTITTLPEGWRPLIEASGPYGQWTDGPDVFVSIWIKLTPAGVLFVTGDQNGPKQNFITGDISTLTYITNNVTAAHLVTAPPVDFSSQITGKPSNVTLTALYSPTTGAVYIQGEVAAGPVNGMVIPAKYRPISPLGNGTFTVYTSGNAPEGRVVRVAKSDGIMTFYQYGSTVTSFTNAGSFNITYYVEPESGAYIITKGEDITDRCTWHTTCSYKSAIVRANVVYISYVKDNGVNFSASGLVTLPAGYTFAQSGILIAHDDTNDWTSNNVSWHTYSAGSANISGGGSQYKRSGNVAIPLVE